MGPILPKPVTTKIVERKGNERFRVGISSMNGMRETMEDDHCVEVHEDWGFFGVFDGHVGPEAAQFMARRFPERLREMTIPVADDQLKQLSLDLDGEFLETKSTHGSTGTFFLAKPIGDEGRFQIQVGNVGDSRVIVGSGGIAYPMTEDHKPEANEGEAQRIIKAGGHVSNQRVDGRLAVSRAYGDVEYKTSGSNMTHKVIALPDVTHTECGPEDFVFLSCDGVFESNFTNDEVIQFVHEKLKTTNDLGDVASAVCNEALERGSKDNITVMIVQLCPGTDYQQLPPSKQKECRLGPYSAPSSPAFRKAFTEMIVPFNMKLHEAVEKRYDHITELLPAREEMTNTRGDSCDLEKLTDSELRALYHHKTESEAVAHIIQLSRAALLKSIEDLGPPFIPVDIYEMREELARHKLAGGGCPPPKGAPQRPEWFQKWIEEEENKHSDEVMTLQQAVQAGLPLHMLQQVLQQQIFNTPPGSP